MRKCSVFEVRFSILERTELRSARTSPQLPPPLPRTIAQAMDSFKQNYRGIAFGVLFGLALTAGAWLILRFVPALLWATVLAVLMKPRHDRFAKRFSPNIAATFSTLTTIALVGVPLVLVGTVLSVQLAATAQQISASGPGGANGLNLESVVSQIDVAVHPWAERVGAGDFKLQDWLTENKAQLVKSATGFAGMAARATGETLFTLVVAFLTLFFILRDGDRLKEPALELIPLPRDKAEDVLSKMSKTIHAVFIGVVLVAVIQGIISGVAYVACGVPSPLVWFVATTVLCAIPLLGAPLVYVPMALLLFSQGKNGQAIALLIVGFGIVSQVDNFLRPFVIGARVNLHPMAIFFSLLGGVFALGPVGIMAGPVLLTVLLALQDVIRERNREPVMAPAVDS